MSTHDPTDESFEPKARKACVNCRRQKMKCRLDGNETCRRCRQAGMPCVFVPRANAATIRALQSSQSAVPSVSVSVLQRLDYIENLLGISGSGVEVERVDSENETRENDDPDEGSQGFLREAIDDLRRVAPRSVDATIWRRSTVKGLWSRFDERMPGLHFMPSRLAFKSPCPLLLAAMLYCSSLRGPVDVCPMASQYFTVLCHALAQLSIPNSIIGKAPNGERQAEIWAFQTILAIVLAGLLSEATTRETGIWISIAYRLILEHCPASTSERSGDWRKLFSGVQIVDLEHASIHLLCPVLPVAAPLHALQTSPSDQLARLSRILHGGLSHFAGRGLPTIWSCFTQDTTSPGNSALTFSTSDAAVIRDWARQLDAWLVEFSGTIEDSQEERVLVFRQYILHRLTVLSIYHPARGCDLGSQSLSAVESYELLLSARAALRLHANDATIWSNWDLVMISWAALIVLQGLTGGLGELADIDLVKAHIAALEQFHETGRSLRRVLISRLQPRLDEIRVSDLVLHQQQQRQQSSISGLGTTYDCSWQIFDQNSFQQMSTLCWGPENQILTL